MTVFKAKKQTQEDTPSYHYNTSAPPTTAPMTATPAAKIPPDPNGAATLAALAAPEAEVDAADAELDTRDDIDAATEERCDEADEAADPATDDAEDASEDRAEDTETAAELRADVADASAVVDADPDAVEPTEVYTSAGVPISAKDGRM
ncbi:hypothetical protein EWM64_g4532 [Hericium alpestre]|uniref:Uncharacterized protein n=1 Tax=Hericium alpestre TaxID=135208 RepID=A0A4Y9ZZH2_9AGAM|nr:hypothetical protein EWM64_g4532 [Hericium alpestre]